MKENRTKKTKPSPAQRRQAIRRPTILSYGLLELAARECGFSFAGMMSPKERGKAERGLRQIRKEGKGIK